MVAQYVGNPQISTTSKPPMVAMDTTMPESKVVSNSISLNQTREKLQDKAFGSLTFLNSQDNAMSASPRPQSGGG